MQGMAGPGAVICVNVEMDFLLKQQLLQVIKNVVHLMDPLLKMPGLIKWIRMGKDAK